MIRSLTVGEVAERVGGIVEGDATRMITGLAGIEDAGADDLTMVVSARWARRLADSDAGAALVPPGLDVGDAGAALVRVENPRLALAVVAPFLVAEDDEPGGISPLADVHFEAELGSGVSVGAYSVIGARVRIGASSRIGPLTIVGAGAVIGDDCIIEGSCTIDGSVRMGNRVRIQPGVRLGAAGFGYTPGPAGLVKMPQIGRCVVGDNVEIAANAVVNRGALGDTVVGAGTKIDSLVDIAHNVRIGRDCIIVAQVGIAGSSEIGDEVQLAGQVGLADHVKIGDGARIAAKSGVHGELPGGDTYFGIPARPIREVSRAVAAFPRLPELLKRVRALEAAVSDEDD